MHQLLFLLLLSFAAPSFAVELTHESAVQMLVKNNLEIIANKFQIDLNRAEELTAGLWANPTLLIDSQLNPMGKNWNQKNAGGPTQRDFILTMPVDLNGKRRQAVKVAKIATKITETYFQGLIRDKVQELLTNLYQLDQIRNELMVLKEREDLLEKSVNTLERRFGSGNTQPLVQSRAKLALDTARLQTRQTTLEAKQLESQIKLLLNVPESETINLNIQDEVAPTEDVAQLMKIARDNRPEFRALTLLKEQSSGQIDLEKRRIWDDVLIQGGFTRQEKVNSRPGDTTSPSLPGAWSWIVGVVIPIPVFDRNQGNVMAAKVQQNQVEVRTSYFERELEKNLNDSLRSIDTQTKALQLYKNEQLKNAKSVRDSALRQFGSGASSLIEYLDAVDAYYSTISGYMDTQFALNAEKIKLKHLSGKPL